MHTRRIVALVLAVLTLPFLVLGLIDPLEGGIALLVAIVLGVVVWAVSRVPVPRITWISMLVTVVIGATTLGIAIANLPIEMTPTGDVANPLSGGLVALNWIYRVGVLVTLAGAIVYIVKLVQAVRTKEAAR